MARTLSVLTGILLFLPRLFFDLDDPIGIPQVGIQGVMLKLISPKATLRSIKYTLLSAREFSIV